MLAVLIPLVEQHARRLNLILVYVLLLQHTNIPVNAILVEHLSLFSF